MEGLRKSIAGMSVIALLTSVLGFGAIVQAQSDEQSFSDVATDHWAYEAVEALHADGVVDGYSDGSFGCDSNANRAEFSKFVAEAFGYDEDTDYDAGFTDVPDDEWYAGYVNVLAQNGVVEGYRDEDGDLTGYFGSGDFINRAAAAKMVMGGAGFDTDTENGPNFSDVSEGEWYYPYIETLYAWSVVNGYGDGTYAPGKNITRCELAVMINNAQNPVYRFEEDVPEVDPEDEDMDEDGVVDSDDNCPEEANGDQADADEDGLGDACDDDDANADADGDGVEDGEDNCPAAENEDQADTDGDGMGDACDSEDDTASEGALTVAEGTEIAAATVPKGATSVEMLNINLTASDEAVTVDQLVVHRSGVGSTSDFSNVYLYQGEDRLTTGRTISSDTNNATFSSLDIDVPAGQTVTVTVVADFATGAGSSNTNYFEVVSADSVTHNGASIEGTFPIQGNIFTMSGSTVGTITITNYGSLANVRVGEEDTEVAKFQLEASSSEDIDLYSIALRVRGSISSAMLSNFTLWVDGAEVATSDELNSKDLMVFTLASPIEIERGNTEIFTVTANIGNADPNDTLVVDLDENTDLVAIGQVYGYGAQVDSDNTTGYDGGDFTGQSTCSAVSDASCTIVEGGQITLSFNGPAADEIATNAKDVVMFRATVSSEINVEVRKLTFTLACTTCDSTSDAEGLINTTSTANFTDIKLVDEDTGETLGSPQDVSTSGSDTSQSFNYTESFFIDAGEERNVAITLDVANNVSLDAEELKVTLSAISQSEGIRNVDTGDYVTDIVPATAVAGNPMTVDIASLAIALASTPSSETYVKGTSDAELGGFSFTAGDASDIEVTSVKITAYGDDTTSGALVAGTMNGTTTAVSSVITAVRLVDEDGVEISTKDETLNSSGNATFSGLKWVVPAGQTKRLVVRGDIDRSATPVGSTTDRVSVDLADVSADITAEDEGSTTVTATGDAANGGTSPTTIISIAEAGVITVAASDNPVLDDKAVADADSDTSPLLTGRFKVYGTTEDFKVTKMVFRNQSGNNNNAINKVIVKYPTSLTAPTTLDGSSSISLVSGDATFTGLNMMVPKSETDESAIEIEVYVVTNSVGAGTTSGNQVELDFEESTGFEAVGQDSGTTITHNSASTLFATTSDVDANAIALYKTLPTFDQHTASTVCPSSKLIASSESEVYCFTVTANAAGSVGLYKLTFDATPNLLETGSSSGQLAVASGFKLYEYNSSGTIDPTVLASGTWASNQVSVTFMNEEVVSAGQTSYYVLKAPIAFTSSTDSSSLSTRMAQEASSVTSHATNAAAASITGNNIWSDRSASSHAFTTADWTHSYKLEKLPSGYLQLSES